MRQDILNVRVYAKQKINLTWLNFIVSSSQLTLKIRDSCSGTIFIVHLQHAIAYYMLLQSTPLIAVKYLFIC